MRRALPAIATLLTAVVIVGPGAVARAGSAPAPGEAAPLFTLPSLEGAPVSLAGLRGRVVVLHFWATWCPICREEMPVLEEAARSRGAEVVVLGINLGERKRTVEGYVREHAITFPILLDARGAVASDYKVLSLPITIMIDRQGRLADAVHMGSLERVDLETRLDRLLRTGS
jgi:cytochrome c biogenesis protein CcmG, thiol:disulfide interchange protein DsbE